MTRRDPADEDPVVAELAALTEGLEAMSARTRRFIIRVGNRGSALLFFFLLDIIYAYSLFAPPPDAARSAGMAFLAHLAPLWVYATLWFIAAIFCLVNAFRVRDSSGFTAAIAIKVLWGLLWLLAAFSGVSRAYVSVTLWLVLAGFVAIIANWPEPTRLPPERHDDLSQLTDNLNELQDNLRRQRDNLDSIDRERDSIGRERDSIDRERDSIDRERDNHERERDPGSTAGGGD